MSDNFGTLKYLSRWNFYNVENIYPDFISLKHATEIVWTCVCCICLDTGWPLWWWWFSPSLSLLCDGIVATARWDQSFECEALSFASEGTWTTLAEFLKALLMSLHRTMFYFYHLRHQFVWENKTKTYPNESF